MHTTSLCFLAFAPMLARALPPERASAPERPPSSLEPSVKHRVVSVAHRHQRVKSCTDAARAAPACRPVLEDADSATAVTLRRLGKVPNTADNPSAVVVSFETRKGRQEQSVELALGGWVVDWPGHRFVTRLHGNILCRARRKKAVPGKDGFEWGF